MDGRKIDQHRIIVDRELGRTKKTWVPRRLGGGKGESRRDRKDEQIIEDIKAQMPEVEQTQQPAKEESKDETGPAIKTELKQEIEVSDAAALVGIGSDQLDGAEKASDQHNQAAGLDDKDRTKLSNPEKEAKKD